jgi:hypothetical protein
VHFAVMTVFRDYGENSKIYNFEAKNIEADKIGAGKQKFCVGRARMRSVVTSEDDAISFAVLHLGDHNLIAGVREFMGDEEYGKMKAELKDVFSRGEIQEVIRLIDSSFENHSYSLWHLFKDEQETILNEIFGAMNRDIEAFYRQIYDNNYTTMQALKDKGIYLPGAFLSAVDFVINADLKKLIREKEPKPEEFKRTVAEVKKWNVNLDKQTLEFVVEEELGDVMELFSNNVENTDLLEKIRDTAGIIRELGIRANFWRAQNLYYRAGQKYYEKAKTAAEAGDKDAAKWLALFIEAGLQLEVRFA